MNDHDLDRVAAAMNLLRPDWPAKSIRTLLAKRLADRPLRDVVVALAWVACEPASSTPARVLEAGPWWRAAAVDGGQVHVRDVAPVGSRCTTCGLVAEECRSRWSLDHEFTQPRERNVDLSGIIAELKGHIAHSRPATEPRPHTPNPHAEAAREQLHAAMAGSEEA